MREKVGKSRNTVFFQWFGAPEDRKVGSLKRRVRSQLARWEMKNCTPLWREAHLQAKMHKTPGSRTTFGSWDVEKVHAVVARSTFRSQNVKNTSVSDRFWKLRCRKSARRCGAKQSKVSKTWGFCSIFNYTTLHHTTLQYITLHYNYNYTFTTFYYTTLHYTTLHSITLNYITLHYITLHYTSLHYTTLHYMTLPSTTLHYITLHSTTLQLQLHNYTPLH